MMMSDPWRVTLLGGLRAQRGEQVITRFKTQRVAALFAYLAFHLRQAHSREVLIELLWPESEVPTLRNSLSVALSSLRHQFEPPGVPQGTVLRADRFSVGLNPATVETDVGEFERALRSAARAGSSIERAQHLTRAVELYQGPLLPGFYEEWITPEQERLSGLFLDALGALVGHLEGLGEVRAALAHARHAVAVDPLREEAHQHLIRLLAAG
jgi:DNA-binding SARP family transcriptional activator